MALTYTAIATVTVGSGGAADIEFTSIPGTYTDLIVALSARDATTTFGSGDGISFKIEFNGSTSNLSGKSLFGNGTNASSYSDTVIYGILSTAKDTSNTFGNASIYIPNYAGSNNKSVSVDAVAENNATAAGMRITAGLWSNSAVITSVKIVPYSTFTQYSTATLYGIKNTV